MNEDLRHSLCEDHRGEAAGNNSTKKVLDTAWMNKVFDNAGIKKILDTTSMKKLLDTACVKKTLDTICIRRRQIHLV